MIAATKVQQLDPPHTMRESNRQRADAYHELLLLLQPVLCCVAPPLTRSWQFAPLLASAALLHAAQLTRLQHKTTGCRSACCADMIHAQLKTHYHSTGGHTQGCSKWKLFCSTTCQQIFVNNQMQNLDKLFWLVHMHECAGSCVQKQVECLLASCAALQSRLLWRASHRAASLAARASWMLLWSAAITARTYLSSAATHCCSSELRPPSLTSLRVCR